MSQAARTSRKARRVRAARVGDGARHLSPRAPKRHRLPSLDPLGMPQSGAERRAGDRRTARARARDDPCMRGVERLGAGSRGESILPSKLAHNGASRAAAPSASKVAGSLAASALRYARSRCDPLDQTTCTSGTRPCWARPKQVTSASAGLIPPSAGDGIRRHTQSRRRSLRARKQGRTDHSRRASIRVGNRIGNQVCRWAPSPSRRPYAPSSSTRGIQRRARAGGGDGRPGDRARMSAGVGRRRGTVGGSGVMCVVAGGEPAGAVRELGIGSTEQRDVRGGGDEAGGVMHERGTVPLGIL
jgi:hypothetical protein